MRHVFVFYFVLIILFLLFLWNFKITSQVYFVENKRNYPTCAPARVLTHSQDRSSNLRPAPRPTRPRGSRIWWYWSSPSFIKLCRGCRRSWDLGHIAMLVKCRRLLRRLPINDGALNNTTCHKMVTYVNSNLMVSTLTKIGYFTKTNITLYWVVILRCIL